jgi:hypothetical protein
MIRRLVVDNIAAGFPERLPDTDHALGFPLDELERDLALQHVAENRPGVPVRRGAGIPGRQLDRRGHYLSRHRDG